MSKAWKRKRQRASSRETSRARIAAAKQPAPDFTNRSAFGISRE